MRGLNPSAVLNFRYPSMAFTKVSDTLGFDEPSELRFTPKAHRRVRNSSIFGKMSTAAHRARDCGPLGNEKPEPLEASPWGQDSGLTLVAGSGFDTPSGHLPLTSGLHRTTFGVV